MADLISNDKLANDVVYIRVAQQLINESLKAKEFSVPVHLAMGHEAIAVAVCHSMEKGDGICLTHRNIHYNLALADTFTEEFSELKLQEGGVASGRLGSMNMDNPKKGIIYTSSILGNNLCVAAGASIGAVLSGSDDVIYAASGDGAIEEGAFYESVELARSQNAPFVLIVENNGWSLGTRVDQRRCPIELPDIAKAFDIPYFQLKGNNTYSYLEVLKNARQISLLEKKPVLIETLITTLGSWVMKADEQTQGKFINYHHGPSPSVAAESGAIIAENDTDPVWVLGEQYGRDVIFNLANDIRTRLKSEIT
ncbi:MAG: thiamine pyrophosphate-dependent enzyme [Pseudomonadota bacterium]|nr:thiamine pyrophosphate-dependent enzyme [Pseudomonadota bacterium]